MATILDFRSGHNPSADRGSADTRQAATAEVVMFPGVRYERHGGVRGESERARAKTRRDTLELED